MKSEYILYSPVTREDLDSICVGDLVKINGWKKPMRVKGISKNYFVTTQNLFGSVYYYVYTKLPHLEMIKRYSKYKSTQGCGDLVILQDEGLTKCFDPWDGTIITRLGVTINDLYVKHNGGNK